MKTLTLIKQDKAVTRSLMVGCFRLIMYIKKPRHIFYFQTK